MRSACGGQDPTGRPRRLLCVGSTLRRGPRRGGGVVLVKGVSFSFDRFPEASGCCWGPACRSGGGGAELSPVAAGVAERSAASCAGPWGGQWPPSPRVASRRPGCPAGSHNGRDLRTRAVAAASGRPQPGRWASGAVAWATQANVAAMARHHGPATCSTVPRFQNFPLQPFRVEGHPKVPAPSVDRNRCSESLPCARAGEGHTQRRARVGNPLVVCQRTGTESGQRGFS